MELCSSEKHLRDMTGRAKFSDKFKPETNVADEKVVRICLKEEEKNHGLGKNILQQKRLAGHTIIVSETPPQWNKKNQM